MLSYRIFISFLENSSVVHGQINTKNNILIYGFTEQGRQFLSTLLEDRTNDVYGFIDKDKKLKNYSVNGVQIYNENDLDRIISERKINLVVLALSKNDITIKEKQLKN